MTITDPIERVVLTHLQIPLKEPFRISGGEVAIKDAILVVLETSSAVGLGESSPMAASFGYPGDTPEECWESLTTRIAPSLLGLIASLLWHRAPLSFLRHQELSRTRFGLLS